MISPEHVDTLQRDGFTKDDIREQIQKVTARPLADLASTEDAGGGLSPERLAAMPEERRATDRRRSSPQKGNIHIVVAGAEAGKFSGVFHGWAGGEIGSIPVSQKNRPVGSRPCGGPMPSDLPGPMLLFRQTRTEEGIGGGTMTTILDPTDERVPVARTVTPRAGAIRGNVALLDISKPRGNILLDRLETQLAERLPEVTVNRYAKPTFTKPAPDSLRRDIRDANDFVIEALAD